MNANRIIAGLIAGIIAFAVNVSAQFLIQNSVNFFTALATAFGVFLIFFLITAKYAR